ncbi:MAG: DUF4175 family protein [Verrucomicrobia bacterium]|nr:DUF4175 family protein [Verrucomicrobiota bacterium]
MTSISAILILTGMYSRMNGLQEMNAFIITTGTLLLGAIGTALGIVRLRRLQPQLKELAEQTESARPELLDSLNTAVAMHLAAEATTGHSTNRFQNALFAKVTADTAVLPWKSLLIPTYLRWASILSLLLVTGILVAVAMRSDTLAKSAFAFADWRADSTSGMTLKPAPMQAALGSDLTVRAQIHRWEQRAWIRIHTAEGQETHVMPINRNGEATFTFYDVRAELRFEVWTPSLRSTRQTVTVFAPPFLDGVKIEVEPPAYTRMPAQVIDGLQDFSAPWGSRLRISADTRHAASAEWIFNQDRVLFSPGSGAQSWILDWQARRTGNFMVLLSNEYEQRESRTHRLTVIPDEPPVVEILHPGRDIQLAPDAIVAFLFYFADDYGLSEATLNVSVAGRMQHSFPMRLQPDADGFAPRELQMPFGMELESLEAEDGDLLSYWVQVADNREPVPQFSRSEVFFIEVRAEREPEEIDGMPMDQERLTLRPQIEELKRLLRLSHRTVTRDGEQRLAGNQQLTSALLELRQSIDEVYERIKPTLEEANDQFFTRGFESALALVDNARDLITADQTEIAIPVQEQALQELLALENALVVEQISREPSEGDGEGEGEGEQGEGEQGQQENPLMALSEALEQLRELQRRQDNQNTSTDRAGRTGADSSQLEQLAQTQDALRRDLGALDRDLSRIPDAAEARSSLLQAEQRMRGAASGLRTDDTGRGWREGTRAAEQLETAGRLLQDIIDSALNEGLAGLQAEAQQLAQAQQQAAAASAAADSEGASSADVDDLLQQQDQLNERLEQLLQNMEGLGQSMQSNNSGFCPGADPCGAPKQERQPRICHDPGGERLAVRIFV